MRYLNRCYYNQLLINKACVSFLFHHLKRLWLCSVNLSEVDMSEVVTWINPIINKACVSYGFLHLIKNWLQSVVLLLFVNNSISTLTLLCYTIIGPQLTYLCLK